MDLGGWLRSLGLEQYEAAFRENEINEITSTRGRARASWGLTREFGG